MARNFALIQCPEESWHSLPRNAPQRKLCGSTSTATLTPPRGGGAAASSARKKPCRSRRARRLGGEAEAVAPRKTAIGASAGPSRMISSVCGRPAERRDAPALAGRHRMRRRGPARAHALPPRPVLAETTIAASRPKGGRPPRRRCSVSSRVEALDVAGDQRGDHRMVRLPGLQQRAARPFAAPGAPGRLAQELKGALGGARIAVGEADIGVDDADQGQQRKIVALGDELRADDDVVVAARRRIELPAQRLDPAGEVGREHQRARVGEQRSRLLGEALDARAAGGQAVGLVAGRAELRPRLGMAAMMADERAAEAVLDQPGRAVRALEAMAAGAAEGQRRVAAAVEEQQRLLAARPAPPRRRRSARRQPAAARRAFAAQVDGRDLGQPSRAPKRDGSAQPGVAAASRR